MHFIPNVFRSIHCISEPTAPRSLTATVIQSTFVSLSWLPPDTPNGVITRYELQYSGSNTTARVNVDFTSTLNCTVEGFLHSTIYDIQIRAYTRVGAGPFSNTTSVMTLPKCKLLCSVCMYLYHSKFQNFPSSWPCCWCHYPIHSILYVNNKLDGT